MYVLHFFDCSENCKSPRLYGLSATRRSRRRRSPKATSKDLRGKKRVSPCTNKLYFVCEHIQSNVAIKIYTFLPK